MRGALTLLAACGGAPPVISNSVPATSAAVDERPPPSVLVPALGRGAWSRTKDEPRGWTATYVVDSDDPRLEGDTLPNEIHLDRHDLAASGVETASTPLFPALVAALLYCDQARAERRDMTLLGLGCMYRADDLSVEARADPGTPDRFVVTVRPLD